MEAICLILENCAWINKHIENALIRVLAKV